MSFHLANHFAKFLLPELLFILIINELFKFINRVLRELARHKVVEKSLLEALSFLILESLGDR